MKIKSDNIHPVLNYLLIEVTVETQTSGGLDLAEDGGHNLPSVGTIIRAGETARYKAGETVMFRKFSADEISVKSAEKEDKFWLLEDEQVIATIKNKVKPKNKHEQIKLRRLKQ